MPDRVQVEDLQGPERLRPQAQPINTFAPPVIRPPAEDLRAQSLIHALGEIQPEIRRYAAQETFELTKDQLEEGAALRVKNQKDWQTAIKGGMVPAGASPWFRRGYDRMDMHLKAQEYDSALKVAYAQSPARNSDNPQDLQDFIAGFSKNWVQESGADANPEFAGVFAPLAARSHEHLSMLHAQDRINDYEVGAQDKLSQLVSGTASAHLLFESPTKVGQAIKERMDEAYQAGMPGHIVNKIAAEAIAKKAVEESDTSYLDLLNEIDAGSGKLGATTHAKEVAESAKNAIFAQQRENEHFQAWKDERAKKEFGDKSSGLAIERLLANPDDKLDDLIKDAAHYDPDQGKTLIGLRKSFIEMREDNPDVLNRLYSGIYSGTTTPRDITEAVVHGDVSAKSIGYLWKELRMAETHRKDVIEDPLLKKMQSGLTGVVKGTDILQIEKPQTMQNVSEAETAFWRGMIEWRSKNPDADKNEMYDYGEKLKTNITKQFTQGVSVTGSEKVLEKAAPKTAPKAQPATPANPDWKTIPKFKSQEELKQFGQKLKTSQDARDAIKALGIDPNEYLKAQYELMKAKNETPAGATNAADDNE